MTYGLELIEYNGLPVLASPKMLRERSILICFTTRQGGVSQAPYDTLNLGAHVGDIPENMRKNRRRAIVAAGFDPARFTTGCQVHGNRVKAVMDGDAGTGAYDYEHAFANTDALVTKAINVPIAMLTADCVPVAIVDPVTRTVAVVHAGYKGLYLEIVAAAVGAVIRNGGGRIDDIIAFIGPAIGQCCYRVDKQRAELFSAADSFEEGGSYFLDLPGIAADKLLKAGVTDSSIVGSGLCTSCRSDLFFSFRRDGVCGRQAVIAAIGRKDNTET